MNLVNTSGAAACCSSCATGESDAAIACTLGAGDFKDRVADIRALSGRSLRQSEREGLTLRLSYAPGALAEVRDLVAKESECCAFLSFDLEHDATAVRLTITAPPEAAHAADELFAHFAPGLAREAA